jgi:SAM-dependent methyltransferase
MKPEYAQRYRELYERHWWWRARERLILEELRTHAPPDGWGSVLDVGCGDGLFFDQLTAFGEVWGVESDAELVSADNKHRSKIHVGSFDSSYQAGRRFRLILMLDLLEHMPDPEGALRQAASLLEPGGRVLATVPAFRMLWTAHDDFNNHVDRYTTSRFRALAHRAGFQVQSARYLFHWLFAAKLAARAFESIAPGQAKPAEVPRAWLNTLLRRVSEAEARLLRRVPVPFGSSVIAWLRPVPEHANA